MKRFKTFGEYMFNLLFGPLKKRKKTANQFFIFFAVVGRIFDDMKEDVFKVRNESNVATASHVMLPVYGQDRSMPRLIGEDIESYRTRLSMKGLIAEWGGTKTGISYVLTAMGFPNARIMPVTMHNPGSGRWAEFIIWFESDQSLSLAEILKEVNKVKRASSRVVYGIQGKVINQEVLRFVVFRISASIGSYNPGCIYLNGRKTLDGTWLLDSTAKRITFTKMQISSGPVQKQQESITAAVTFDTMWRLDGVTAIDGSRKLNADIIRSEI